MFGMDARITVGIFAAMAGIVGVVGFTKLDIAKHTALLKEFDAIDQAYQGLQADMGVFIRYAINSSDGTNDVEALWDNTQVISGLRPRWLGPYYSLHDTDHQTYGDFTIDYLQADRTVCTDSADCYVWIKLSEIPESVWNAVNDFIDEDNGDSPETSGTEHTAGLTQASASSNSSRTVYYRSVKRPRN